MTYEYKVSVIVPIYNLEKYLYQCIQSIINQTLKDIQVIAIDDGSKDNSGKIADEFGKIYKNFKVIHKKNGGLSDARNLGLDLAEGKYIMFLDGDDALPPKACEILYTKAEKENSDIVIGKPVWKYDDDIQTVEYLNKWFEEDLSFNFRENKKLAIGFPVATSKLFKTSLIKENNIKFPLGITGEDVVFSVYTFHKAKKITVIPETVYWRTERRDGENLSITQQANIKVVNDRLQVIELIDKYCNQNNLEYIKIHNRKATFNYILQTIKLMNKNEDKRESFKAVKEFIDKNFQNRNKIVSYMNLTYDEIKKIVSNALDIQKVLNNKNEPIRKLVVKVRVKLDLYFRK